MRSFPKHLVAFVGLWLAGWPPAVRAQAPSPEDGATLFPGGALVSYNSVFTSRRAAASGAALYPTFGHDGLFTFSWGVRRDVQVTAQLPVVTKRLDLPLGAEEGGTGLGDLQLHLKYRFLRRDSERGTTQASLRIGPKLPTGRTDLRGGTGALLPASRQSGSGSTDLFLGLSGTYTGVLHVKRLVADATAGHLKRTEGTQGVRLGDMTEARFWLSYRPYQTEAVGKEWFIGPSLSWHRIGRARARGAPVPESDENVLFAGVTNYVSPHPGIVLWLALDFPVARSAGTPLGAERRISFGITRQFVMHH